MPFRDPAKARSAVAVLSSLLAAMKAHDSQPQRTAPQASRPEAENGLRRHTTTDSRDNLAAAQDQTPPDRTDIRRAEQPSERCPPEAPADAAPALAARMRTKVSTMRAAHAKRLRAVRAAHRAQLRRVQVEAKATVQALIAEKRHDRKLLYLQIEAAQRFAYEQSNIALQQKAMCAMLTTYARQQKQYAEMAGQWLQRLLAQQEFQAACGTGAREHGGSNVHGGFAVLPPPPEPEWFADLEPAAAPVCNAAAPAAQHHRPMGLEARAVAASGDRSIPSSVTSSSVSCCVSPSPSVELDTAWHSGSSAAATTPASECSSEDSTAAVLGVEERYSDLGDVDPWAESFRGMAAGECGSNDGRGSGGGPAPLTGPAALGQGARGHGSGGWQTVAITAAGGRTPARQHESSCYGTRDAQHVASCMYVAV